VNKLFFLLIILSFTIFEQCSNPQYVSVVVHRDHGRFFIAFGIPNFSKLKVKNGVEYANLDSNDLYVTSSILPTTFYGVYNGKTREFYDEYTFKDTLQKCFSKIDSSTTHDSAGFFYYIHGLITYKYYRRSDPAIQDSIKPSNLWAAQIAQKLRNHIINQKK